MKFIAFILIFIIPTFSIAQNIKVDPVLVEATTQEANVTDYSELSELGVFSDGGENLGNINGISIQRKGGHGNDPVMHGLKENQLNVKIGERFVHGACPNRMDPPSSYASPELYEIVEVQKGVYTLTEGRGGPGGTIIYKEKTPTLKNKIYEGKIGGGYAGNTNTKSGFTQLAFGKEKLSGKIKYAQKNALDYRDGDGNLVRSSFNNQVAGANIYWNPTKTIKTQLKYETNYTSDAHYAGLSMDAPRLNMTSYDLGIEKELKEGFFKGLKFATYQSNVDHLMSNELRNAPMLMEVDSQSDTTGGRLLGKIAKGNYFGQLGVDFQNIARNAKKFHNHVLNTYMWPDSHINQLGLFTELQNNVGFKYGLRVDFIHAEARKAKDKASMMMDSAAEEYEDVYGKKYASKSETNVSALVRYNKQFSSTFKGYAGLSRTVRTADAKERYIHKEHMSNGSLRETGNPNLKPEEHHQLDMGIVKKKDNYEMSFSVYYNNVTNYITKDRARAQDDILVSDSRVIYRNINALLMGAEASTTWQLNKGYYLTVATNYTYGQNTTDKRALYEIPPLGYRLSWGIKKNKWHNSMTLKGATSQPRVDANSATGSGVDVGKTKGWAIVNLQGSYSFKKSLKVNAGIANLFDYAYATHLNMVDVITGNQVQINQPGRSGWINMTYAF